MTFKKKSVKVKKVKTEEVAVEVAAPAVEEKPVARIPGYYLDGQKVRHIGSQPIDTPTKWDAKENIRDGGEYKPCPADSGFKDARYIPVTYKDFGQGTTRGFVIKTPEEVMLWALESERA